MMQTTKSLMTGELVAESGGLLVFPRTPFDPMVTIDRTLLELLKAMKTGPFGSICVFSGKGCVDEPSLLVEGDRIRMRLLPGHTFLFGGSSDTTCSF